MAFTTLAHHVDVALLERAFKRLNPQSAPGVDRVTWRGYKENLESNLETLHDTLVTEPTVRKRWFAVSSRLPNPLPIDMLVGEGMVDEAEFGFIGFQFEDGFAVAPSLRRAIQEGTLRFRERDVYELIQGFRAAAMGLPFLAAPGCERSPIDAPFATTRRWG